MPLKKAFTLAEVLITITIIGIVASITVIALVADWRKTQTVTQLKKAYSEINSAVRMSESKYGTIDTWDFADFASSAERISYFSENFLYPNIKIIKKCIPSATECWPEKVYNIDGKVVSNISNSSSGHASFISVSGYSVYYWLHGAGNGGWYYIDINGHKKPNRLGKDIFPFVFSWGEGGAYVQGNACTQNYIGCYPYGLQCKSIKVSRDDLINGIMLQTDNNFNCKKGSNMTYAGGYCGALIVQDNWQIKKDYPW